MYLRPLYANMASTETMTYQDNVNSQYLSNSLSNLSHSRSTNSLIVRTYKQATQQYLTKQFKDALETIEPIISPQQSNGEHQANGYANGDSGSDRDRPALIAQSSRGTRTKVWVFYLSLLHAIVDLGQEEGKLLFGSSRWRELAAKVREGTIWEEVGQRGYSGLEGEVDADVVVNLATLLLGHMQDQRLNQQRLETYLAASDTGANGHLSFSQDGMSTPMSNSSSSPKQLATRLKILELYTLHVLPANGEWDYAKQFIDMNDMIDEERKEAFVNALQNLKEEKDGTAKREKELKEQREQEMEERQHQQEAARKAEDERKEDEEKMRKAAEAEKRKASRALNGSAGPKPTPTPKPSSAQNNPTTSRPSSKPQKKPQPPSSPPPTMYRRASSMLMNLQHMVLQASRNLTGANSMALVRFLMFMLAFLLIIARRDLRLKLRRAAENGWVKVKQTVGMGVKVSYI